MGEYHWNQVDDRPREAGVLHEPYAGVHVVRLVRGEEREDLLEVPSLPGVGLARAAAGRLQRRDVAGRDDRDAQGAAHDRQEPFRERFAAGFHGEDGRDPDEDPPDVRKERQLLAQDEGGVRAVET